MEHNMQHIIHTKKIFRFLNESDDSKANHDENSTQKVSEVLAGYRTDGTEENTFTC